MNGLPFISSPVTGGVASAPDPALQALIAKPGGANAADLTSYARGRPFWTCRLQFAGPAKVVEAQWEWTMEQLRSIPGVTFSDIKRFSFPLSDTQIEQLPFPMEQERRATFGIPSLEAFMLGARSPLMPNPSHGHMWLSPVLPRDGEAVIKAQNVFLRAALEAGIYLGSNAPLPLAFVPRTYLMILPFLISEDPEANRKSRDTMSRMIDIGAENGWLEYRAHPAFQDQVMKQYNFSDHALLRFHERIKDALDPNEVLAAGRYGIWPRSMRSGAPT